MRRIVTIPILTSLTVLMAADILHNLYSDNYERSRRSRELENIIKLEVERKLDAYITQTKLNIENFNKLELGWHIDQCAGVLGHRYTVVSESIVSGKVVHLVEWDEKIRTIHLVFQNNKLMIKTQIGLE